MNPGDYILVQGHSPVDLAIQAITEGAFNHAAIVSGDGTIIEALPSGVREDRLAYPRYAVYSVPGITDDQRGTVVAYGRAHLGERYGFLQDMGFAIDALRRMLGDKLIPHLWAHQGHVICSALVDLAYRSAGIVLRTDREPGDVTPTGLVYTTVARLIKAHNLWEV